MREEYASYIEKALREIPDGTFLLYQHNAKDDACVLPVESVVIQSKGKGKIESFLLFPGIEISHHRYLAQRVRFHHEAKDFVLEMNHCGKGRIGWNMDGGQAIYLGQGDLCIHSTASCANSEMTLPLGYYEGITVTVDLQQLQTSCPEVLRQAGFEADRMYQTFCATGKPTGILSNDAIERAFAPLYDLPEGLRVPYYKLKTQEILLYLLQWKTGSESGLNPYGSEQTERIREIHDFLIAHLDQRFTIEELSKKYLLNTASLKTVFRAVYGMPIASYVKECRMQRAMQLLRDTDDTIAAIAQEVGYETQSKFTKAFKERMQILPTEYRKLYAK